MASFVSGGGGGSNGVFIATQDVTTYAEVKAAYDAGKTIVAKYHDGYSNNTEDYYYYLSDFINYPNEGYTRFSFFSIDKGVNPNDSGTYRVVLTLDDEDNWAMTSDVFPSVTFITAQNGTTPPTSYSEVRQAIYGIAGDGIVGLPFISIYHEGQTYTVISKQFNTDGSSDWYYLYAIQDVNLSHANCVDFRRFAIYSTNVWTSSTFSVPTTNDQNYEILDNAIENEGIGYIELGDTIVDHMELTNSDWDRGVATLANVTSSITLEDEQWYKITINNEVFFKQALQNTHLNELIINIPHLLTYTIIQTIDESTNIIKLQAMRYGLIPSSVVITIQKCNIYGINKDLINHDVFVVRYGGTKYNDIIKAIQEEKIFLMDYSSGHATPLGGWVQFCIAVDQGIDIDTTTQEETNYIEFITQMGSYRCYEDNSYSYNNSTIGYINGDLFFEKGIPIFKISTSASTAEKTLTIYSSFNDYDFSQNYGAVAICFTDGNTANAPYIKRYNTNYPIACPISATEYSTEAKYNTFGKNEVIIFHWNGTYLVHSPSSLMVYNASKDYTTAGQKSGTTLGEKATAEGDNTTASGINSHAEGSGTKATAAYAHAEGVGTTASNSGAHAEGMNTTASGMYAHAEGWTNTASSQGAHAEGMNTYATNQAAHAEGCSNTASGYYSHAEGYGTTAQRRSQHVFGELNVLDTGGSGTTVKGTYVEIVGNGTADNARSNARTLDWSGNETLAGKLTVGADPVNNMDVATKQYVDNSKEIFVATYGTTTYAEINTAYTAGKTVIVARDFNGITIYTLSNVGTSGTYHFRTFGSSANISYGCYIGTDGVWHVNSNTFASQSALETGLAEKQKIITVSTEEPTSADGVNGDIWFVYEE